MVEPAQHLQETFADQKDSIDTLSEKDPEFRSLCRDFDDCVDALRYWIASGDPGSEDKAQEYRDLLGALHGEIRLILKMRA